MHHTGQSAKGEQHLVEIMKLDDLNLVDLNVVSIQLNEAKAAYMVIEQFMQTGQLTKEDYSILDQITTEDP